MIKTAAPLASFLACALFSAPANYNIKQTPSPMTIDGDLSEWNQVFFLDTFRSDDNVYYRDSASAWTPDEFQAELYAAWDQNFAYFGVKITRDDAWVPQTAAGDAWCYDNLKINPGGQNSCVYLQTDGQVDLCGSSPFQLNSTFFAGYKADGNGGLPTFEFSISKTEIDPFSLGNFQFSVGAEENDAPAGACTDANYLGFGAEYTGNKTDGASNPWDNAAFYPTFTLTPGIAAESPVRSGPGNHLSAAPNPSSGKTIFSSRTKSGGFLEIFNLQGVKLAAFVLKPGVEKIEWTGADSPGLYIARFAGDGKKMSVRLVRLDSGF